MPNKPLLLPTGGWTGTLGRLFICYIADIERMHFVPLDTFILHTKGCYCQQIGEGGVNPGAMLNMELK